MKVNITLIQIGRAKLLTIEKFQGDLKEENGRLWDYLDDIKRSNPGRKTQLKVNWPIPESLSIFEKLYISFDYLKNGFLGGCRKIIGLDGWFLKRTIKCEILAIVGRDGKAKCFQWHG